MRKFLFLMSDVSISWVYSLVQILFWQLMYLHRLDIRYCRCSFGNWCICKTLIFVSADALFYTYVSAPPWYSLLQMLFWQLMYLQLRFLWTCRYFSACLACIIASASCLFWDLRIHPLQIFHLHPTFSITWGCFSLKLCILNLLFLCFADTSHPNFASSLSENSLSQISSLNIL